MYVVWMLFVGYNVLCSFFFFQAEDGIRDLVRSRGLGDVYKRQPSVMVFIVVKPVHDKRRCASPPSDFEHRQIRPGSVSYTHLTLPTSDLV